jgi:CubicO group peptidase (beta-lactamase class C family)
MFPPARAEEVGLRPERVAAFERELARWVDAGDVVGGELLIVSRGKAALHAAAGWRDRERAIPWRRNTVCRIRSMTKPFVGTVALMLVEEGRLTLDERVARWLPAFDRPGSRDIRVEHLLQHVAGFDHPGFPERITAYGARREAADAVGQAGPSAAPGARFCYSDAGSLVLAELVSEVAGEPIEALIERRIIAPLGLTDTFCLLTHGETRRFRLGCTYKLQGDGFVRYWDNLDPPMLPFFAGAGGMYSTAADQGRFLAAMMAGGELDGVRLLQPEMVERALTVHPASRDPAAHGSYGMHWYLYSEPDPDDERVLRVFGHDGSDGTFGMAVPGLDLVVLYFTQSRGGSTLWRVMSLVRELVRPD